MAIHGYRVDINKRIGRNRAHNDNYNESCKEMGGATSVMPVIRGAFSQQAAATTQWADTIDWTTP